jgi:hypothetical protein
MTRYLTTERLTAMSQVDARIVLASTGELIYSATLLRFDEAQRLCRCYTCKFFM